MANLQLNIEVNDEDFKTLCTNNINDLPKDKIEELLLKAVEVALIRDKENSYFDREANILVSTVTNDYGFYRYEPTQLLKDVMGRVDLNPYVDKLATKISDYIQNNYEEIIKRYVIEKFADMLFSDSNKYELRSSIVSDVNRYI